MTSNTDIKAFFDEATNSVTYVVAEPDSGACAIIDPVLDFDPASGRTSRRSADQLIEYLRGRGLEPEWILETHVHADHLSAAAYLRSQIGGKTAIGQGVRKVQETFGQLFNAGEEFDRDGSQFDKLLADGENLPLGSLMLTAIATPGHTPACMTFVVDGCAFVGDTLFMPDFGTARTDFPGGDAATLYRSIQRIFALPAETRLYLCHDYKSSERDRFCWETTVAEQRERNIHIGGDTSEAEFVRFRDARDSTLSIPRLLFPAVQVNMRGGELPPAEENGTHYMKLPVDVL